MNKVELHNQKILVVDDEKNYRIILGRLLEGSGYDVILAETEESALAIARQQPVSLVLTDLRLKQGDGLELCRRVQEEMGAIPCVVFTAHASESSRSDIRAAGIKDCLIKPFRNQEVVELVQRLLCRVQPASDLMAPFLTEKRGNRNRKNLPKESEPV